MVVQPSPHGDFHYLVVTRRRTGKERVHEFASEDQLEPGDVLRLDGRYWLIASTETGDDAPPGVVAVPARYRLHLRHPDGREELGGLCRLRPDPPRLGHSFTTLENGQPVSWEVVDQQLEQGEQGEPYLGFTAERDFAEVEALPSHELEHTLARSREDELPQSAQAAFDWAEQMLGRRGMISSTYLISGALLIVTGELFVHDKLDANQMTIAWCLIFFFASSGAGSAYLSVSELFLVEARAMAIALFYAFGTGLAALSPTLFGHPIQTASRTNLNYGYLLGAGLMIAAGVVASFLAVPAERRALEDVAIPFTAARARGPTAIAASS